MSTITFPMKAYVTLWFALEDRITALEERIRLIDTDYANDEDRRLVVHKNYASFLQDTRDAIEILNNF